MPIIVGEWDKTRTYEPLMVVTYQGASYTSRQYVPAGIEITNESYWVLSANYNAQVEAYRKEVQEFDGRIAANANSIVAEKTRAEGAEQTLQGNIDNLNTALADEGTSRFNADNALQAQVDGLKEEQYENFKPETTIEASYFGRIVTKFLTNKLPQSIAIKPNSYVMIFANEDNSSGVNSCTVVEASRSTGELLNMYERDFGHANSCFYDEDTNKFYVCPCIINSTEAHVLYECDPLTYNVTNHINMPFEPHSIYKDRITGEWWITSEVHEPSFAIYLYKVTGTDFANAELVGQVPTTLPGLLQSPVNDHTGGTQNISAYNGHLFYCLGGEDMNVMAELEIDKSDKLTPIKIKKVININAQVGAYSMAELENCIFDENGDVITFGIALDPLRWSYGVVGAFSLFGNKVLTTAYTNQIAPIYNCYIDPQTTQTNMCADGSNNAPYTLIGEAICQIIKGRYQRIVVMGTGKTLTFDNAIKANIVLPIALSIALNAGNTIEFDNNGPFYYIQSLQIEGNSSNPAVATMNGIVNACGYWKFKYVTMNGTLNNEGILQIIGNPGSKLTVNSNSRGMVFTSDTQATYNNSLQPK